MGSIRTKKLKDGTIHYHAEIRINKKDFPPYREAKTFANKKVAQGWIATREAELRDDPKQFFGATGIDKNMTVGQAIDRYMNEIDDFGRTKINSLNLLKKFDIARIPLTKLSPLDISNHAAVRKQGIAHLALEPIKPSTIGHEMAYLFGVLDHANIMWGVDIDMNALKRALKQLKKTRNISRSGRRDRLVSSDELIRLTAYFYKRWQKNGNTPMHLIMWFAIVSARRQGEIARLALADDMGDCFVVRDVKNPKGSKGNHKKFKVYDDTRQIIEQLKSVHKQVLNMGYDETLLIPVNQKTICGEFTKACHILAIDDLHFHDLRHEACTRLAERGLTIPQIQEVSLHDSWTSLERYVSIHKRPYTLSFDEVMREVLRDQN
ncbi:chorismate mutase family protein [Moraxella macacae 0408225]|uniref:Chorismate mutase family protein n=1 Tax=Moraxella macacae 0408225 TaxID=1230338 RepID=L2F781_9GAMM|nr:tyrosine-type recombinase/integrase [Moraxella macacae]ELA08760.1 chorismate mutase family protein [Moraxella macacae 0408225]